MASNNYVPVKVLHDELAALISESNLLNRDVRLERAYMIYRLGLIDDLAYRDLNREICKRFPDMDMALQNKYQGVPEELQPHFNLPVFFSNSEMYLISEQLSVRLDQMKYMIDKYTQRPGNEKFVESHKKEFAALIAVSNKIVKLINCVNDKEKENES